MLDQALLEGVTKAELSQLPIYMDALSSIDAVPADHFFALHEFLDQKLEASFAIRVGQEMQIEDYGVLGLSWRTCSHAGEIFTRSERYFKLLSDTYLFKVEKGEEHSTIYLHREPYRRGVELSNEATLSATVVVLQAMTEQPLFPTQVAFKHAPPPVLNDYEQAFQCPVLFNQPYYSITYTTEALETRTAKADEQINHYLLQQVEEKTKGIKIPGSKIVADVEARIKSALPTGIPSIHHISALMAMSNRTLARRLAEAGLTYRDLVKRIQENIAKEMLQEGSQSIGEIAYLTGFSEQSAFNRAFKKWTGQTPSAFKKNP